MKVILYSLLFVLLGSLLLTSSCTKKPSECANCYGVIYVLDFPLLRWNYDSVDARFPDRVRESDWCKFLEENNNKEFFDEKGNKLGTLVKECENNM